jgi:hypothetical protein
MTTITMTQTDIMFCIFLAGLLSSLFICIFYYDSKNEPEIPKVNPGDREKITFSRNYNQTCDILDYDINNNDWYTILNNQEIMDPSFDRWLHNTLLNKSDTMEDVLSTLTVKELSSYCDRRYRSKYEMVQSIMMRLQSTKNANIQKKLQRLRRMLE